MVLDLLLGLLVFGAVVVLAKVIGWNPLKPPRNGRVDVYPLESDDGRIPSLGNAPAVKSEDDTPPLTGTETTTIVGSQTLECGEDGSYRETKKRTAGNKFDRDHIPSKAALQQAAKDYIFENGITLSERQAAALFGDYGLISMAGQVIVTPKGDHKAFSQTYTNKNTPEKIERDAGNLQQAAEEDTRAMEDAEGKEMDADCVEKYRAAARRIRAKTHQEYIDDLAKLVDEVQAKYPTGGGI
ncbi:hypothetical protein PO883_33630 [Massilia sp. DJPM01]|uniref:hypothetical protein n=1 Tax=Massilia sp. DJPM01 TaxID=3024404 RepID=UPI00259FD70D|nr:hypothetical protein [Massilia sp. DJPM01]MDM5182114.1 hypothetical protein [Massilia sp. DJPM01]